MRQEFAIEDEWLPYEIHPETPGEGILLADYFPGMNPKAFFQQLNLRGQEFGIRFGPQTVLSNSRLAMEAGEFAKEQGVHEAFHEAVFRAFFTECQDIGDRELILGIAANLGLDRQELEKALDQGIYLPVLQETTRKARDSMITAAPTFVVQGHGTITGAQPVDVFRAAFRNAARKAKQEY